MCSASGVCEMKSNTGWDLALERTGIRLLGVDEVGNLIASRMKKTARLLPDEVPVAVLGVELHREAARVAPPRRSPAATGDVEKRTGRSVSCRLLKSFARVYAADRLVADPCRRPRRRRRRGAAGVHHALRDALPVEVVIFSRNW
jgi:hypothetical protein